MAICTASYVLAAAGLLDGRPATTHWNEADHFQRSFPQIQVDANVLFVDEGRILTAAGVAAGIDLCLHLVRRDHGSEIANRVARLSVVPPGREGGQAQYIDRPVPEQSAATTASTRGWALRELHRPLPLAEPAENAGMSVRTFCRRFRDETGMPPGQWLTRQRVEHARRLLETTDLPIDQVAALAGFGTAASLRQRLAAAIGVPPRLTAKPSGPVEQPVSGSGPRQVPGVRTGQPAAPDGRADVGPAFTCPATQSTAALGGSPACRRKRTSSSKDSGTRLKPSRVAPGLYDGKEYRRLARQCHPYPGNRRDTGERGSELPKLLVGVAVRRGPRTPG
ncbi:GlxA family transcriptional regulator [Streptosporangium minutum]|uniref:HTH araC/xylS-type domain-containing protein n=1 Tax=Streptosporangium minutum TaxID=569862 RepID=A0A243RWC3_9ACTN|nr:hypothetical protein CA984_05875 [Streptosporangium minutum]